jgi:signal transduction histidine kinase
MRVTQQEFWRMDLPLAISTLIVSAVSFVITVLAGIVAGVLFASPLIATPRHPVDLSFNSSHPWLVTRRVELWWMIPLGLVIVAFILLMCWLLGTARMWLTTTLSRDPNAEKVRTLTGEVSGLRSGRATLVDAYEVERTRIERDLHDGAQQRLIALTVQLGAAHMAVKSLHHEPPSQESSEEELTEQQRDQTIEHIDELLDQAQNQAEKALHELREVVHGIHPQVLTDLGLVAAVQDLCSRSGLDVHVTTSVSTEVSQPVSTAVYFALCELLTNVIKHADVTQADLDLHIDADGVQACVSDHGKGGAVSGKQGHTGLAGISQRLAVIGGTMTIDSRLEVGTTVTIQAPLQPPW